ncbi:MAG TPA: TlpA disulfide reductase family protein [Pyrinomonadaceae bacterium]|jgi:thiol-disulfide isomerase/thioredoxin
MKSMPPVFSLLLLPLLLTPAPSAAPGPARAQSAPAAAAPQTPAAPARPPAPAVKVEPPRFVPEDVARRELKDVSGRGFRLADFGGRVYVVNLWATWCGPCHAEVPGLNKVYEDYAARGVRFVGLTTENPEADAGKVREFARQYDVKYRLGWVDAETAREMASWNPNYGGRYTIPQTFVVAADGRIVLHVRGYNPRVPEMIRAGVERALRLGPAPAEARPPAAVAPPGPAGADAPAPRP